ncbi:unnamed protein product [Ectocarpus sp. 13 AM-2016]
MDVVRAHDDEEQELRSKEEILGKFDGIEQRWKVDPTPEGFQSIMNIFQVTCAEDLVPERINEIHRTDWNSYIDIRDELTHRCDDELTDEDKERFCRFQETIFHAHQSMMMFMRSANCNGSFPTPLTPETIFWYSPLSENDMTPYHYLILYLLGELSRRRYRRFNGFVYRQVFIGNYPTHAWEELCEIKEIVRFLCDKETHCEMWKHCNMGGNYEQCVKYLANCCDLEFPDLNAKRRVWSFNDGIYDATEDTFTTYDQEIDEHLVSCKIIYKDFYDAYFSTPSRAADKLNFSELKTPLFDSIFQPQMWDENMLWWMYVFVGRLFYEVSELDSWQVIPFMKGVAGTGKSTVIKVPEDKVNPGLMDEIQDTELPAIIRKSALAYRDAVQQFGNGDIWQALPPRIREQKKKLQYSTNPLFAFINSDNVSLSDEEYTLESIFVTKLKSFAALKFPHSTITFNEDFYSYIFGDFGLSIRKEELPWPRSSTTNVQTQNYLFGCKICDV